MKATCQICDNFQMTAKARMWLEFSGVNCAKIAKPLSLIFGTVAAFYNGTLF